MRILNLYLHLLYWILLFTQDIFSYNVDTKNHILYHEGPLDNYFGFSVGLIKNTHGYRALITAPRANSSSARLRFLHQPGALFSCSVSTSGGDPSCEEVEVDPEGNVEHINRYHPDMSYVNKRDDMWLGVSLDTQHIAKDNNVVVCGHLWKSEISNSAYYANGACYVLNSELNTNAVDKIVPFVDTAKNIGNRKFYYDHTQTGASATFSEDGRSLLLGSPGYSQWKGTFVSYQLDPNIANQKLEVPFIPSHVSPPGTPYVGYSITTGNFFGDGFTYSAVGAPRDNEYKGIVYIFEPVEIETQRINAVRILKGTQVGEYFGAAVSGIDLNGDGLTDLLVGAPFYSQESGGDEGKVYVYISGATQNRFLAVNVHLDGNNKPNARFGTCIGNTGDLNQDRYNDVAIGAPYEDEKGAVYIYYGDRYNGINYKNVQRISAEEISPLIAGFGISISRGLDVDDNSYPDILIGSYASSNAVLLRTHPVISLSSTLSFNILRIDKNITTCDIVGLGPKFPCVTVTYCLEYTGKISPLSLEFQTQLTIDTNRRKRDAMSRGFFLFGAQGQWQTSISRKMQVSAPSNKNCFQETAYVHKNISDEITPIDFLLSYSLDTNTTVSCQNPRFPKDCPVVDPDSPSAMKKSISFKIDCEGKCEADLSVEALIAGKPKNRNLIIGQDNSLTLDVRVRNKGEPAYVTELFINLPPETPLVKYDQCEMGRNQREEYVNTTLLCRFRNALKDGETANVQIVIDAKNIPAGTSSLAVHFRVTTVSTDIEMSNNEETLFISFEAAADVNITGNPENPRIPQTEAIETVLITHNYYVKYYGPSPVDKIDINIYVPSAIKGDKGPVTFLTINDFVRDSGEISTNCSSSFKQLESKSNDGSEKFLGSESIGENRSVANLHHVSKRSSEESETDSVAKRGQDYILDCESARCDVIHCEASPFRSGQKSIKFVLTVQVDLDVLSSVMEAWNSIEFITKGDISMHGVKMLSNLYRNETTVETAIFHLRPPGTQKVQNWIIFVSVGVGLLLLLIILVVLIKIGFFKRKQKEKMKSMRQHVQGKEMQAMSAPVTDDDKELCPNDRS